MRFFDLFVFGSRLEKLARKRGIIVNKYSHHNIFTIH
jgi:hypothetical protein